MEQFTAANGERHIAGSDRDYGLVILRYTGPGAVGPTPEPAPPTPPGGTTPPPAGGGGTAPPADSKEARIRAETITIGKNRRFRVAVNCPESAGGDCMGTLRVERARRNLVQRSFRVTADTFGNISGRLSRSDYRALTRKRQGHRVRITVLTRDAAQTLRHATVKVTMRAKR